MYFYSFFFLNFLSFTPLISIFLLNSIYCILYFIFHLLFSFLFFVYLFFSLPLFCIPSTAVLSFIPFIYFPYSLSCLKFHHVLYYIDSSFKFYTDSALLEPRLFCRGPRRLLRTWTKIRVSGITDSDL